MMIRRKALRAFGGALVLGLALLGCGPKQETAASAAPKKTYTIAWSIYAGWMPWPYAAQAGIVKKWADKYGIDIKIVQADYVESINQYTAGKVDGVAVTTLDALTIPAAGGKDTSIMLLGDYSNGNDGLVLKGAKTLAAVKGRTVNLVQFSVSHYLLARALEKAGLKFTDIKTVNTSDADVVAAFGTPQVNAVVTWNPQLSEIKKAPGATEVFNSSAIPGEIVDTLAVSTDALKADPNLGKALAGIWYETLALMEKQDADGAAARAAMAKLSGTDQANFESQLKTTYLYADPKAAAAFATGKELAEATDKVRKFAFDVGLFPKGATSADAIGIALADGTVLGDKANVKLRFDPTYMQASADGGL